MARSIWKGSITFGLVNIPVGLYPAEKREEISFHLLDRRNQGRVRYKRINEDTGKEVPWEDTVRGYELDDGRYVILSDTDLKSASPEATQTIEIVDFVDLDAISPLFFDKPYYLAPDKKGAKSYALLRETLRRTGKVGIAKVVIRTKQYLAALLAQEKALVLEILRFGHELREPENLDLPSGKSGLSESELGMAKRLVEGMVSEWKPDHYRDDYYKDLMKMIDQRAKAGQLDKGPKAPPKPKQEGAQVVDLVALLKKSLEASGGTSRKPAKKAAPRKTAAKKTEARKRKTA